MLADGQAQIRTLTLGPGTAYQFDNDGPTLWADRDVRTNDEVRPGRAGLRAGNDLDGGQTLTLPLIIAGELETIGGLISDLHAAWARSTVDVELAYSMLGEQRSRFGRPRRIHIDGALAAVDGTALATLEFLATDPLIYEAADNIVDIDPSTPGPGFTPPFVPPIVLGAGDDGTLIADNIGTAPAHWSARIDGPVVSPSVTDDETGLTLDLSAGGGLQLLAGQYVELDSRTRSVLVGGIASRSQNLTLASRWFMLGVGPNRIRFASASGGHLSLTYRSAWL